jgi:hypothetical protein
MSIRDAGNMAASTVWSAYLAASVHAGADVVLSCQRSCRQAPFADEVVLGYHGIVLSRPEPRGQLALQRAQLSPVRRVGHVARGQGCALQR